MYQLNDDIDKLLLYNLVMESHIVMKVSIINYDIE